ncbi:MAG: PKD domain-containing protein [Gammaproteobacteria bacterium]
MMNTMFQASSKGKTVSLLLSFLLLISLSGVAYSAAPTADAGPDQTVLVNDTVTLDGSGSSDSDGDSLTYDWSLTTVPAGSSAALTGPTTVNPSFTIDVAGTYTAELTVNDGTVNSVADEVIISTTNSAPLADAGADQSALVNDTVTLDGSGSTDVDGDSLTYNWSLTTVPVGSSAALTGPTTVYPSFTIDVAGTYTAQLIVNDGTVNSIPDTVNISTTNSAPVADAGADQSALVNDTVTLDGSGSTDVDGDALTYSWSLTSPTGSTAVLSNITVINPSFTIDVPGTYTAQLIVNDGTVNSFADTVNISTDNTAPVADAGVEQASFVGGSVILDGSSSNDADGDALTFSWSLTAVPEGSTTSLSDPTAVSPSFVIDVSGNYIAQLIVNDGSVNSAADTVRIIASGPPGALQFSDVSYNVNEYESSVLITVTRVGGSAGHVTVNYDTRDDTAVAGSDFITASGTLSFADGVTSQSFVIGILEEIDYEGNESLSIILSNPTGGASLGSPSLVTLVINDKDTIFDGTGGGSIDVLTLMFLLGLYVRNFRRKHI